MENQPVWVAVQTPDRLRRCTKCGRALTHNEARFYGDKCEACTTMCSELVVEETWSSRHEYNLHAAGFIACFAVIAVGMLMMGSW